MSQQQVGENDVKDCGQRPADVVKGDTDIFQAQVVGGDHHGEHDGDGKDLEGRGRKLLKFFD